MKKILLLLIICLTAFTSCQKESNPINSVSLPTPTLVSPLDNSTNELVSPILIWNASNGASSYNLNIATDSGFTNIVIDKSKIKETSYNVTGLNNSTFYYWRVQAINNSDKSEWSEVWQFITGVAPSIPTLSSPENNSLTLFMPITFYWDSSNGASGYTLQISTSGTFTSFEYNQANITSTNQQVTTLKPLTQYYWRVNANGNGSSNWSTPLWTFITASGGNTGTSCPGLPTITYSGRIYHTVQIGNQCWLKENLDVGTMIPGIQTQTNNNIIEKFCYNNDTTMCKIYGGLYQWDEVMQYGTGGSNVQGICPTGWHIPDTTEFNNLSLAVNNSGNALKALAQGSGSSSGTDASGFSALLSGYRGIAAGFFGDLGLYTNFWSSIEKSAKIGVMWLGYDSQTVNQSYSGKQTGFSLRCIKD